VSGATGVTGPTGPAGPNELAAGSATGPSLFFTGDNDTGIWSPAADTLAISNGGSETLRTDSAQRLLVGVTSGNANGGVLQLNSGITFPATQVDATDANTLDDYEEGTFTPIIEGESTPGAGTYTVQLGRYTKIGRMVHFAITLTWSAHTGTGNMRIPSLPFTANSTSGEQIPALLYNNLTSPSSTIVVADIDDNTTNIRLWSLTLATGTRTRLAIDTAASMQATGVYMV
jgi:hypothetical protein